MVNHQAGRGHVQTNQHASCLSRLKQAQDQQDMLQKEQ